MMDYLSIIDELLPECPKDKIYCRGMVKDDFYFVAKMEINICHLHDTTLFSARTHDVECVQFTTRIYTKMC